MWLDKTKNRLALFVKTAYLDYRDDYKNYSEGFLERLIWHELQKIKREIGAESGFSLEAFLVEEHLEPAQYKDIINSSCRYIAELEILKDKDFLCIEIIRVLKDAASPLTSRSIQERLHKRHPYFVADIETVL